MCAQIQQHIRDVGLDKDLEDSVWTIFTERWNKMHSPLHAAAYMLEPQFRNAHFGREMSPSEILHFDTLSSSAVLELSQILQFESV